MLLPGDMLVCVWRSRIAIYTITNLKAMGPIEVDREAVLEQVWHHDESFGTYRPFLSPPFVISQLSCFVFTAGKHIYGVIISGNGVVPQVVKLAQLPPRNFGWHILGVNKSFTNSNKGETVLGYFTWPDDLVNRSLDNQSHISSGMVEQRIQDMCIAIPAMDESSGRVVCCTKDRWIILDFSAS